MDKASRQRKTLILLNMLSKLSKLQVLQSELNCLKHENVNLCERRKIFIVLGRGLNQFS
jgi:hypothetical protein